MQQLKRLTVHLKGVKKETVDGQSKLYNTKTFKVKSEDEGRQIMARMEEEFEKSKGNTEIAKFYFSNIK